MTKKASLASKAKTPANDQHLLKTKIVDLVLDENIQRKQAQKILGEKATEAQIKAETERRLKRAQEINDQLVKPLGTSARPFPMYGSQRTSDDNGSTFLEQALSVIADDAFPMKVYSERDYKDVIALAYCDMPVPSMLQLFFDGLERRKPESTNRTQMMIGDPGAGKSFMGGLQGRLRSKQAIEVFDCGGKNMNELLFEMVLDFGAGDALPKAIDKRLKAGSLEPLSLAKLRGLPGASLDGDGNIQSIDWNFFKGNGANQADVESAFQILKDVSQIEGLDKGGGNALGMNSQYGPLIKWFIEGREGVLDEYNKSKEGSDNALQTVWQFLNGEINVCTVENPLKNKDLAAGPASFTFRREDVQAGFFVTLTGNKTEDGLTTRSLNKSVYSRLSPQTLPDPTEADWQHRICQMMVGMPVSTLYDAFKDQADANPKAFGEWLLSLRKAKAEIEGVPVPELQETLLQNWQNVNNASEKLAKFYNDWANMTNADNLMTSGNTDLIEEVDEEYTKKEGIDFRKIKQHLEEAVPIRPKMQSSEASTNADFGNFLKQPVLKEQEAENPSVAFGTRLVDYLDRVVYEKSEAVGKSHLYKKLLTAMETAGLRDVKLTEGARSTQKSVEEDLNVTVFDSNDLGKQALAARKVFCNFLREMDKLIQEPDDDKLITAARFKSVLKTISEQDTAQTKELFVINRDHETLLDKPLTSVRIEDTATYPPDTEDVDFTRADVVAYEDFMASLALPTVSAKNLAAIWEDNIRPLLDESDDALDVASGKSPQGIAATTLRVVFADANGEQRESSVHIIVNQVRDKTLVIGEKVPSKLQTAFKEAGIIHIDRNETNAKSKIETAISELTRGMPDSAKNLLSEAFKYRNYFDLGSLLIERKMITPRQLELAEAARGEKEFLGKCMVRLGILTSDQDKEIDNEFNKKSLAEILLYDKMEPMYPKYLVKNKAPSM